MDFSQIEDELEAMINDPEISTELSTAGANYEMSQVQLPESAVPSPKPNTHENESSKLLAYMG